LIKEISAPRADISEYAYDTRATIFVKYQHGAVEKACHVNTFSRYTEVMNLEAEIWKHT